MRHKGFILYQGPSAIDGMPIVVIATLKSDNPKTGPMVQTWIMRADMPPTTAINEGADASICGSCVHRGILADGKNRQRSCYVAVRNAPNQVWKSWKRGIYTPYVHAEHKGHFAGRAVRLGSYGDPVAIPLHAIVKILRVCKGHTGYTHQWQNARFAKWSNYLMASCDSIPEMELAQSKGWRTFRTRLANSPVQQTEIVCPASPEGNNRRTCETCLACDGSKGNAKRRSIVIIAHGSKPVMRSYERNVNERQTLLSLSVVG